MVHSTTDNDAVTARAGARDRDGLVLFLAVTGAERAAVIIMATAGAATVELDTLALSGDAIALARAGAAVGAGSAVARERGAGRGVIGAVGQGRASGRDGRGAEVGGELVLETGTAEAGGKFLELLVVVVVRVEDVLGGMGRHGLWGLDLRDGERAALGDVNGERGAVA